MVAAYLAERLVAGLPKLLLACIHRDEIFFKKFQSQLKGKDSPNSIATCVFTLSPLFFPPGDGFLLRRRAPLAAPGRGAPGGLRLLGPVPPAQLPHAVPPAGGRLGRGESRR